MNPLLKKYNYSKNKHCICGKLITNNSKKCRKCADKEHSIKMLGKGNPMYGKKRRDTSERQVGKKNPMYKHGKSYNNRCIDCNKIIDFKAERCQKHAALYFHIKNPNQHRGKNNPAWNGGISFEPYSIDFTNKLKDQIRKRDNYKCQKCFTYQIKMKRKLEIHHIDYDKQNCKEDNLISLCRTCHAVSNGNRDYWYAYFKYIINSYIYNESRKK